MTTVLSPSTVASSFSDWAFASGQNGLHPLVYIVGTRGKSTVARLLDAIAREAGLRTALRTDAGVEIEGKRQLGDIHPLVTGLQKIDRGELDLGIIEMDWNGHHTLPLGNRQPGAVIVSTICPHKEYCLLDETRRAIAGLKAVLLATPASTMIAADIDDSAFPLLTDVGLDNLILTTASEEQPVLHQYLADGALASWISSGDVIVGTRDRTHVMIDCADIPVTLQGAALFQIRNVMQAAAVATAIGIDSGAIERGLKRVTPDAMTLPTSLNCFTAAGVRVIVDRPSPSWFLGPLLRAARTLKPARKIFVIDYRDSTNHDDTVEIGRMIGRQAGMCVLIDDEDSLASVMAFKAGAAQNEVPPLIAHAPSLSKAIARATNTAREDDLVIVLTNHAQNVYRSLARRRQL
jgi:cyanophycin synthetase